MNQAFNKLKQQIIFAIKSFGTEVSELTVSDSQDNNAEDGYETVICYLFNGKFFISLSTGIDAENRAFMFYDILQNNGVEFISVKQRLKKSDRKAIWVHINKFFVIGDKMNDELILEEAYDEEQGRKDEGQES